MSPCDNDYSIGGPWGLSDQFYHQENILTYQWGSWLELWFEVVRDQEVGHDGIVSVNNIFDRAVPRYEHIATIISLIPHLDPTLPSICSTSVNASMML